MTCNRDSIAARIRALIDQAMIDEGLRLKSMAARGSRDFDPAYGAGRTAAERVALNRGVRGREDPAALLN